MKGASSRGSAGNANMRQTGRAIPSQKPLRGNQNFRLQGQGPNRAAGHKGGTGRQGSKRG
jgi:hypothetical protein